MIYKRTPTEPRMSALAKLNEVLFENSDSIPEGLYLQLMNLSKGVFDENSKLKTKTKTTHYTMLYRNYKIKAIKTCYVSQDISCIQLIDSEENAIHTLNVGNMIQTLSFGDNKIFFEILKINKCTTKFMKHAFTKSRGDTQYRYTNKEYTIRTAKRVLNENNEETFELNNNISLFDCVYDIPTSKAFKNYLDCISNVVEDDEDDEDEEPTN